MDGQANAAHVVRRLPADSVEYTFTDIGPAFIARARREFASHAFMRFEVDVMSPKAYGQWMAQQPANSIHCVGGSC